MKIKENKRIDVKRMFEIEKLKFCQYQNLSDIELEYLNFAIKMPIEEIKKFLDLYDNIRPKLDEIKLILSIQKKYSETKENVLKRIRQVRQITKYEEGLMDSKKYFI